jgi:hypothetical protein
MVRVLMFLCFAISWPISKLLDAILGEESANLYARGELKELVYLHGQAREDSEERLTKDEIMIIKGAMDMVRGWHWAAIRHGGLPLGSDGHVVHCLILDWHWVALYICY